MKGERDEVARSAVLAALAAGASVTAAARAGGVARQTPYQWADRGDEEMREALEAATRKKLPGGGDPTKLHEDERLALETLRAVAQGERDESGACTAQVQAARALLEHHRKRRQYAEATKIGAPPASAPRGNDDGLGALITKLSG